MDDGFMRWALEQVRREIRNLLHEDEIILKNNLLDKQIKTYLRVKIDVYRLLIAILTNLINSPLTNPSNPPKYGEEVKGNAQFKEG